MSVVMATYNGARWLPEQLLSLAAQTVLPAELIVSDDGSDDGTPDVVARFARDAPFPVVVRRNDRPRGYGDNFLGALELATGEFVAFCDQDDVWHPTKLEAALETLTRTGACLYVHQAVVIDGEGRRVGRFRQRIRRRGVHPPLHLPPWGVYYGFSMVFPRALVHVVDATERGRHVFEHHGQLSHDLWVYFLATSLGRTAVDDRPLVAYRRHGANVTPSGLSGLRSWIRTIGPAAHPALRRDEIAAHRARLLDRLSARAEDDVLCRAAGRAARHWDRIAACERARLALYAERGRGAAALCWAGLVARGGYRSYRHAGLGSALAGKDLLLGVIGLRGRPGGDGDGRASARQV
nr:glycosyltransferase [Geodermatophilus sp. DSM 45219]